MEPLPLQCRPPRPPGLNSGTYNIQDGRGLGLPQAIRDVQLGNYGLMLLNETKIMDATYWHKLLGYSIVCSQPIVTAAGGAQWEWAWLWGSGQRDVSSNPRASTDRTWWYAKSCMEHSATRSSEGTYPHPLLITFLILRRRSNASWGGTLSSYGNLMRTSATFLESVFLVKDYVCNS